MVLSLRPRSCERPAPSYSIAMDVVATNRPRLTRRWDHGVAASPTRWMLHHNDGRNCRHRSWDDEFAHRSDGGRVSDPVGRPEWRPLDALGGTPPGKR